MPRSEVSVVNSSGMLSTAKLRGDSIVRCIRGLRVEGAVEREGAPAVHVIRYLRWALRAHRHVTPDAYAYANSKYIGAQTHGKQGMSALREVLVTHDVSETVRTYLNARGIVHTKRTCKTAAANVSEASSTEMAHPRRAQCVHTTGPRAASHADGLLRGSLGC